MIDAYLEFLTENSQRKYPLLEDCVSDAAWPDNILLDVRGFTRAAPEGCFLLAYSGSSVTGTSWDPGASSSSLFFGLGTNAIARVDVPFSQSEFPYTTSATVADSRTSAPLAGITVTISKAWLNLSVSDQILFGSNAPLENCTIVDLHRQQVDLIGVLHTNDTTELFEGDVVLRGGYNVEVTQNNQRINVSAIPGRGELGEYPGDGPGDECRGLIYSISGASPNGAGKITFVAGKGIKIVSFDSTVQIFLDTIGTKGGCS